jgi:hypothetical protein
MILKPLRRSVIALFLLALAASPVLAAGGRPLLEKASPAAASFWSALFEKTLEALGLAPAPPEGGAQTQEDRGPGMDPAGI